MQDILLIALIRVKFGSLFNSGLTGTPAVLAPRFQPRPLTEGTVMVFEKIHSGTEGEFEQIVFCNDSRVGLKAIIGIHSTVLGPATGGCRMWKYESEEAALTDVLRLSKGMTYKASISGLNWGGGKAVIIGDAKKDKTPELLKRYAEFVDRLGGTYITAKDVGIGSEDLKIVQSKTRH